MPIYDFVFSRQVTGTRIIGFFAKYGELPTIFHLVANREGRENIRSLEGKRNTRDRFIYMIPLIVWAKNMIVLENYRMVRIPKNRLRESSKRFLGTSCF